MQARQLTCGLLQAQCSVLLQKHTDSHTMHACTSIGWQGRHSSDQTDLNTSRAGEHQSRKRALLQADTLASERVRQTRYLRPCAGRPLAPAFRLAKRGCAQQSHLLFLSAQVGRMADASTRAGLWLAHARRSVAPSGSARQVGQGRDLGCTRSPLRRHHGKQPQQLPRNPKRLQHCSKVVRRTWVSLAF